MHGQQHIKTSKSLVQYTVRHLNSHIFNVTSPAKMQRVTNTIRVVQQDCFTLFMEVTHPFDASGTASHPTRTEQSATPLT